MPLHMNSSHEDNPEVRIKDLSPERRRVIRAWCIYDWANSAFVTSGVAAIMPIYFVFLFKEALGESATIFGISFTGSSVWSLAVVISTLTVALSSPVLGVISDRVPIKKTLLWIYTGGGALFTVLAFFSAYTGHPWAWLIGTFALANIGFSGSLVFYNSFLPHLGPRRLWDDISSRGFAYGYAGGGILLLAHLALDSSDAEHGFRRPVDQDSHRIYRLLVVWLGDLDASGGARASHSQARSRPNCMVCYGHGIQPTGPHLSEGSAASKSSWSIWLHTCYLTTVFRPS